MNKPQQTKSVQSTVHEAVTPPYNEWQEYIHAENDKVNPYHIPQERERPYVTWPKKDSQVNFSEKIVYWIGCIALLFGLIAWVLELF